MMIPERPSLERRVLAALDGSPGGGTRIPVVLGGCGSGRTSLLLRLRDLIGRSSAQYVDVERIATTPERFLKSMRDASPFPPVPYGHVDAVETGARGAFDAVEPAAPAAAEPQIDYLYEPEPAELFKHLLPSYVEVQVYRALLESNAAFYAAQMTAMDAATRNSGEMIEQLTLYMNKVRQAAITREIIEVVSGAQAL
jgi:hypothetical protein